LSLSGGSDRPTVQQERKFGIAADEAGGSRVAGGAEAAGVVVCGDDLPGRNLGVKALQRHQVYGLKLKQVPYECTGTGGDNEAVAWCDGLQARREVRGLAEHGKFGGGADRDRFPDYDNAAGNADTASELRPIDGSHGRHRSNDIEPGSNGPFGVVLVRLRIPEIDEHAVAHELRHEAVKLGDARCDLFLISFDRLLQAFKLECRGEPRGINDVTEHHRQVALFGGRP
jgi:hypothetical protein